ncbi:MAG: choice-of-anchor P family protein, partial [Acidimicrobiales bacterium]
MPLLAMVGLAGGAMALAGPSAADASSVGGSAFGASVSISSSGGPPTIAEPLPAVALPSSGGSVDNAAPAIVVGDDGSLLEAGPLTVASEGTLGSSGSTTSTASVAAVDALGGTLTATDLASTCTATEGGSTASATVAGGDLVVSGTETVALPAEPAPNTVIEGTVTATGDAFTVTLNEQDVVGSSITVTAVRVVLAGPTAVGEIVLAQSRCDMTATMATAPAVDPPADEPSIVAADEPTVPPSATAAAAPPPGDASRVTPAAAAATASPATAIATTAAAAATTGAATAAQVAGTCINTAPGAYGFCASIRLGNLAPAEAGPEPTVTLPAAGSATPVTDTAPTALARLGPGTIFTSGPLEVSTTGSPTDAAGITSTASIEDINTSGDEVFTASAATSTCTSSSTGSSGSTTITGGTLRTSDGTDADSAADDTVVPVPANPGTNTRIEGALAVGDSFTYIFNEQIQNPDGSITVNAAHLVLGGPLAFGDVIIGQSRCGA